MKNLILLKMIISNFTLLNCNKQKKEKAFKKNQNNFFNMNFDNKIF